MFLSERSEGTACADCAMVFIGGFNMVDLKTCLVEEGTALVIHAGVVHEVDDSTFADLNAREFQLVGRVDLRGCKSVTDVVWAHLGKLPCLGEVRVANTGVTKSKGVDFQVAHPGTVVFYD